LRGRIDSITQKSYDCAPNSRELYDIAHKKMEDEIYYNMDKNDAKVWLRKRPWKLSRKESNPLNG